MVHQENKKHFSSNTGHLLNFKPTARIPLSFLVYNNIPITMKQCATKVLHKLQRNIIL